MYRSEKLSLTSLKNKRFRNATLYTTEKKNQLQLLYCYKHQFKRNNFSVVNNHEFHYVVKLVFKLSYLNVDNSSGICTNKEYVKLSIPYALE